MRFPNWRSKLVAMLDAWAERDAGEPDTNCGIFVADCILAMTGVDHAAGVRGQGFELVDYMRALREAGFRDAVELAEKRLVEVPASHAQFGDVVAVREGDELALGICNGATIAVVRPAGGIGFLPLTEAVRAFRAE